MDFEGLQLESFQNADEPLTLQVGLGRSLNPTRRSQRRDRIFFRSPPIPSNAGTKQWNTVHERPPDLPIKTRQGFRLFPKKSWVFEKKAGAKSPPACFADGKSRKIKKFRPSGGQNRAAEADGQARQGALLSRLLRNAMRVRSLNGKCWRLARWTLLASIRKRSESMPSDIITYASEAVRQE